MVPRGVQKGSCKFESNVCFLLQFYLPYVFCSAGLGVRRQGGLRGSRRWATPPNPVCLPMH